MNKFKKYLTVSNLITVVILGLFLYHRVPVFLENKSLVGKPILPTERLVLNSNEAMTFPNLEHRYVLVFWASWCGPCKVEMNRLKTSVLEGKIPGDRIVAINVFEEKTPILKFIQDQQYPFTFLEAPDLGKDLRIELTPTTVFVDKGVVQEVSTGMSLVGIWRAEKFLKDDL